MTLSVTAGRSVCVPLLVDFLRPNSRVPRKTIEYIKPKKVVTFPVRNCVLKMTVDIKKTPRFFFMNFLDFFLIFVNFRQFSSIFQKKAQNLKDSLLLDMKHSLLKTTLDNSSY